MTTFQVLIEAFGRALTHLLPFSPSLPESLFQGILHWNVPSAELELLILLTASLCFLAFFRFDWLGLTSALITSLTRPLSLKSEQRTLDQHSLIFLALVFTPAFLLKWATGGAIQGFEALGHPYLLAALSTAIALGFRFSWRWNKRILGLNHLKISHGLLISLISLLSAHPGFPLIGLLWIGFGFCNYHYESIFKYSMLVLGLSLFTQTFSLLTTLGFREAFDQVGHLNSIAVIVVGFSVFWIGLENLQKNLSENTLKTFQWLNLASAIVFLVSGWLKA